MNDYTYDNLNRLTRLTQDDQGGNAVAEKRIDLTYDAASRYDAISRYANLAGTQEVATGTHTFDDAYRLVGLDYTKGVTSLVEYDWSYDAAGRMTQYINSIDGTVDYTHDYTNQLTDADYNYQADESYTYDDNGNRTNAGYVTGDNNQLLSDGTYRYSYDDEGNREFRYVDADSSGTLNSGDTNITEYEWDHRNRLIEVEDFTTYANYDAGTSDQIVEYSYDCFNRLITRMLDPDGTSGATAVEQSIYSYDGSQIVAQFDKTGTGDLAATDLSHRYLWNPQAIDQLFADEQVHYDGGFVTDELLWALTDHQNSVRDLATYDSQQDETTIATHRVFDSFGKLTSSTGSEECLFGYTGKLYDDATGLQNNWNRWYDAAVGKWLSEDAIWDGTNLTRYVGNSPLTNVDPLGLCKEDSGVSNLLYRAENTPIKISPTPFRFDAYVDQQMFILAEDLEKNEETRGKIPSTWKWSVPFRGEPDRNEVLEGIHRFRFKGKDNLPGRIEVERKPFPAPSEGGIRITAPNWWKGTVPPNGLAGPFGCGPCVGVILIPPPGSGKPVYIFHFKAGESSVRGGFNAAGANDLKGYTAVIVGGQDNGEMLNDVIQSIKRRGGTIKGYMPSMSAGIDSEGNIYWTDPIATDPGNLKDFGE